MGVFFSDYETGNFYDEMFSAPGVPRDHYKLLLQRFQEMGPEEFERKRMLAAGTFLNQGVTFTVYSDNQGTERISHPDSPHGGKSGPSSREAASSAANGVCGRDHS